ncbi:hypothetical protein PGTUg99_021997 [Puccinia graminis f. sp. tritici]|uniref:Uncharacterized protein n=1 Tax=Puccinia graminis f. sp. tritici TaxID=56615 RepID=A0A5B0Q8S6_PUCGR|nr:hypothetical protein PGTUg99_021997 [Puccinia graminis f. sp. tritici]
MGSTTKRPNPPGSRTSSVSSIPAAIRNKKKKTVIEGDDGSESGDSQEVSNPETPASTQNSKEASRSDEQELTSVCAGLCWTDDEHNYCIAPPTRSGVLGPSLRTNGSRLDELRSSMTNRLEEERTKFEAEKSDLILQHAEQIKSMESRHEDQINDLKAEHEEILVASLTKLDLRRTRKFESNLSALQEKHLAEINEIKLDHQKQIEAITANPETSGGPKSGTPDGDSTITYLSEVSVIRIVTLFTRAADADTSLTEWEAAPADPSTQHPTAASSHILFLLRNRP